MTTGIAPPAADEARAGAGLLGRAEASAAGPISEREAADLERPPRSDAARALQLAQLNFRQVQYTFGAARRFGDVFGIEAPVPGRPVMTRHPDHARSLLSADPSLIPSLTAESPLRPIVGPRSVLTANGPRHLRQRKLLLPPFHGEAIDRYAAMISAATERELDRWQPGTAFALTPRMQAITLDVIMAGIFGIEGEPARRSAERKLRSEVSDVLRISEQPWARIAVLQNVGRDEPVGLTRVGMWFLDRAMYRLIAERRGAADLETRRDIMSLLMCARTAEGEALDDRELRDELLTLILAGHETTANQLAWTWERLVRSPAALEMLRDAVRTGHRAAEHVEAAIIEGMRVRPVIPTIGRRVQVPWRFGEYAVPAHTPVFVGVMLMHHRSDLYPDPFSYRPERWLDQRPGTYEWLPFGGGTRRCLGAALAMAEMRVVLEAMVRRLDLVADDPEPEREFSRNVTMLPMRGGRVRLLKSA